MKPRIAIALVLLSGLIAAGGAIFHNYSISRRTQAPSVARIGSHAGKMPLRRDMLTQKIVMGPEDQAAEDIRVRKAAQRLQAAIAAKHALAIPVASAPASDLVKRPHAGLLQGMEIVTVDGKLEVVLLP